MKVRVKLYARLERYLPDGASRNEADMDVADGATAADVLGRLGVPGEYRHLVLVNGVYLAPGERAKRPLEAGDHLAVWPPVAGGAGDEGSAGGADNRRSAGGLGVAGKRKPMVVEKVMAVTHGDFFRSLPAALGTAKFRKSTTGAVLAEGARRLEIALGPEGERRIAGLRLPATKVTLTFTGYSDADAADALERFERAFQRGGG